MRKCFALVWLFDVGLADFVQIKDMLRHKLAHSGFDFSDMDTNENNGTTGRDEDTYNDQYYDEYYEFDPLANNQGNQGNQNSKIQEDNNQNDDNIIVPQTADGLGDVVEHPHLTAFLENALYAYGCWCYFGATFFNGDDRTKGYGTPIDGIDESCQLLSDGYDCAIMDGMDDNEPCLPWEVNYTYEDESCHTAFNDNDCRIRACQVEEKFVDRLYAYILSGEWYSLVYMHSNNFSPVDECLRRGAGNKGEKACCGEYPNRRIFHTMGSHHGCCGAKLFDNSVMECCDDETISLVCF